MVQRIKKSLIADQNDSAMAALQIDSDALGNKLARADIDIETLTNKASDVAIAKPSWGTGTGGTRFARFPGEGEPRTTLDNLDDWGA